MSNLSDFTGAPEGILSKYEEFTVSGTWTKDPGATWVYVEAIGGGGGGILQSDINNDTGGGGGGGYDCCLIRASEITSSQTVTIGTGGARQTVHSLGNNGSDSSFGNYCIGGGGYGGGRHVRGLGNENPQYGGDGGDGTPGGYDSVYYSNGYSGYASGGGGGGNGNGNNGGDSVRGGAGGGGYKYGSAGGGISRFAGDGGDSTANGEPPGDGQFPGGGGGASHYSNDESGAGADGVVRIWQW